MLAGTDWQRLAAAAAAAAARCHARRNQQLLNAVLSRAMLFSARRTLDRGYVNAVTRRCSTVVIVHPGDATLVGCQLGRCAL